MRKINLNILLLVCVLMMTLAGQAVGRNIYVDPNGSADFTSIQVAIDYANVDYNEIVVAPGTYNESINFIGKAVRLRSSDPNDPNIVAATIIDGTDTGQYHVVQCVNFEGPNTILEGFTITGGDANGTGSNRRGGGMYCSASSPTVTNCRFIDNFAVDGGGMFNHDHSNPIVSGCTFSGNTAVSQGGGMINYLYCFVTVTNCTFRGNTATSGGGMMNNDHSNVTAINCTFTNNSASHHGGGMYNYDVSVATVANCVFGGNSASDNGGGMMNYSYSNPNIINCTFGYNSAESGGGGIYSSNYSSPTLTNCILWGNTAPAYPQTNGVNATYSNVQGGSGGGTGNIDANPLFVNAYINDFRLLACSPCVDAGDNSSVPLDTIDIDGDGDTTEQIPFDLAGNPRFFNDEGIDDNGLGTAPIVDMGAYERDVNTPPPDTTFYVPGDYNTIQEAIFASGCSGSEIIVAPGIYQEAIDFNGKAIRLRSSGGPDVTTINGNGAYHVVQCIRGEGLNAILEGFTITGGDANGTGSNSSGGGMYCYESSPTVANCNFIGNFAVDGGGMFNYSGDPNVTSCTFSGNTTTNNGGGMCNFEYSSPTVTNCTFIGNSAAYGGGMLNYTESCPTLTNCIFRGNEAVGSGGGMNNSTGSDPILTNCIFTGNKAGTSGGGMMNYYYSDANIINCTFSGNSAVSRGGGIYNLEYCYYTTLTNCILWGNTAGAYAQTNGGNAIYSDVQGGTGQSWFGTGCIDADPGFVNGANGDLRLGACSPCVDAGDNSSIPLDSLDLDGDGDTTEQIPFDLAGNPRFVDDEGIDDTSLGTAPIVDMGAYERQLNTVFRSTINVPGDFSSIQAAIAEAYPDNDVDIVVTQGTYNESINFNGKAIRVHSVSGPDVTTINGTGYYHVVQCVSGEGPNTILEGFTITGGKANGTPPHEAGGGMRNYASSPTVTNCRFIDNFAVHGGGMLNSYYSDPNVTDCTFINNNASSQGGGMYNYKNCRPIVTGCTFRDNTAEWEGGGMRNYLKCNVTVTNCTFNGNTAESGGGMMNHEQCDVTATNCEFTNNFAGHHGGGVYNFELIVATFINCMFVRNSAGDDGGGMMNYDSSYANLINCTFGSNSAGLGGGGIYSSDNSALTLANCILWDNTATRNPQLNGGTITYSNVQGGWGDPNDHNIDADPLFVNAYNNDFHLRSCSPCVDAGNNAEVLPDVNDLAGNDRIVDGDEDGTATVDIGAYECQKVTLNWPVYNKTLNRFYCSISSAIDDANDGDIIEVWPGTYYETIDFNNKAVHLYSSDGPEVTIIDGTGYYHVVQFISGEGPNTILEGFTITGGNANGTGEPNDRGGGMYCENSSPTVTECIFTGNSAEYGGGMCNWAASPTVINCFFVGNRANLEGGAILNEENSEPNLTNCSLSGNDANSGGGIYNVLSSPVLTNCILWGDIPNEINDVNSTSIVTYSVIQGGWTGEGNIDKNPLLRNVGKGDLSLAPWSPCIDSGNNAAVAGSAIDVTGWPRLVDGDCNSKVTVDMGAYEFQHAYGGDFDSSCLVNMADYAFLTWAWLASPQSDNWDPVCDISIPADGRIDVCDVKVLTGNWLNSIDTPITCDANRLKDEFGLDAVCAATVLSAAPCMYSPNSVALALYDAGYSAAGAYQALTQVCGMTDGFPIEKVLYDVGYPPDEYLESTALSFVKKFAPVLYFDRAYEGLPMSAQVYFETVMTIIPNSPSYGQITWSTRWNGPCWMPGVTCLWGRDECTCGMQNNNFSTLINGEIPTYYKVISDIDSNEPTGSRGRLRIWYNWFYGFQAHCNGLFLGPDGAHHGDWEHVIVTTDPNRTRVDAVTYSFHGDWYTRLSGDFETEPNNDPEGRPVVYVGRLSHGNWHSDEISCLWEGSAYHCCTYADCRTPDVNTIWRTVQKNLVGLSGNSEPWMRADRRGSIYEYYGREYEIEFWRWGPHISYQPYLYNLEHTLACGTHPTTEAYNWTIASCDGDGCGDSVCEGFRDKDYPTGVYYNQGWPWGGGSASSAGESATPVKPATPATYGSVASCGRCGASRFSTLARLGEYWLATP